MAHKVKTRTEHNAHAKGVLKAAGYADGGDISGMNNNDIDNYTALRKRGFSSNESFDMGVKPNKAPLDPSGNGGPKAPKKIGDDK